MNYVSIADSDGNIRGTVPVETNGGTVRVAVGEVGRRSEVWRIWANPKSFDVYVAARSVAGIQKFSLHESGQWRYAFTDQAEGWVPEGADRALDKWERRSADEGFLAALAIEIRGRDVVEFPDATKPGDVIWIDPPPETHYVSIRLSFLTPDVGVHHELGGSPLAVIGLVNDSALIIAYQVEPILPDRWEKVEEARRAALKAIRFPDVDPSRRLAIFSNGENGIRYVFDTAVLPDEIVLMGPTEQDHPSPRPGGETYGAT